MKVFKRILIILVLVLVVVGGVFVYKKMKPERAVKPAAETKRLDNIKGYDYVLYDNSNKLYRDLFFQLKVVLEKEEVDEQKYAELISKMFIADFYTLNNKVTNNDIGGVDFIYSKNRENFKLKASDTLYKYIESNVYGDRKQVLPEVESFGEATVTKKNYSYISGKDDPIALSVTDPESYTVKINWTYKNNLNYQKSAIIQLVHEGKVLSIVSVQ